MPLIFILKDWTNDTVPSNWKPKILSKSFGKTFRGETILSDFIENSSKQVVGKVVAMYLTMRASLQCATQLSN